MPGLGRARAQPQPASDRLLRDRALPVSPTYPGGSSGSPGAGAALAVVESVVAPADSRGVGLPSEASGDPRHASPVSARLSSHGHGADERSLSLWLAAHGHRWHTG